MYQRTGDQASDTKFTDRTQGRVVKVGHHLDQDWEKTEKNDDVWQDGG